MAKAQLVRPLSLWTAGMAGVRTWVYVGATQTLAALYYDQDATQPAANPQILDTLAGTDYGKWAAPLYTSAKNFHLRPEGFGETGVYDGADQSLDGVDVSAALVGVFGQAATRLDTLLGLEVHVSALGQLDPDSADANTTLLQAGLAIVAGRGGGTLLVPGGTWPFTKLVLGPRQVIQGDGRDVTTLVSRVAGQPVTAAGNDAGLVDLTLDGAVATAGSVGVFVDLYRRFRFQRVVVKRFERGLKLRGGGYHVWEGLGLDSNTYGAELWSDDKDRVSKGDTELFGVLWVGGVVAGHVQDAVHLKDQGEGVHRVDFVDVAFDGNAAAAVRLTGATQVLFRGAEFRSNAKHLLIEDNKTLAPQLQTRNVRLEQCLLDTGRVTWADTARDVVLSGCRIRAHTWEANSPTYPVILDRCDEVDRATYLGDATKVHRLGGPSDGRGSVTTTDATATTAWSQYLEPGQMGTLFAKVAGRSTNSTDQCGFILAATARRLAALLGYKAKVAAFNNGAVLTGQLSGATATVIAHDTGASGAVTLVRVRGTFLDSEVIIDDQGGQAQVDGPITLQDCGVIGQSKLYNPTGSNTASYTAAVDSTAQEIIVTVTGVSNRTMEWTVDAEITLSF